MVNFLREFGYIVKSILKSILHFLAKLSKKIFNWFLKLNLAEKIILFLYIPALITVNLPAARFFVFQKYYEPKSPIAVYLILIVILMFVTSFFSGKIKLILRIVANLYYAIHSVYLQAAGELTHANEFQVYDWYFLNWLVPLLFIITACWSFWIYERR